MSYPTGSQKALIQSMPKAEIIVEDIKSLQKVQDSSFLLILKELHAHLNGSLTEDTINKLSELKRQMSGEEHKVINMIDLKSYKNLDECFQVFSIIHQLTDTSEAIYLATSEVIKDFARDNVLYLELRTTPRQIQGSYNLYLDSVIKAIDDSREEIMVKLLLSIDRSKGLEIAQQVVEVTIQYAKQRPDLIIGLDVSGNMVDSKILDFFPLLNKVRQSGLKLSIHTAEIHNDEETEAILVFHPDRIGHGTFIPPIRCNNPRLLNLLKEKKIPIELCLTSNVFCKTVQSYQDHHLKIMIESDIPFALCTDDKGVFGTTLSEEYQIASQTFSLSLEEMWKISLQTLSYGFMNPSEREILMHKWQNWFEKNKSSF